MIRSCVYNKFSTRTVRLYKNFLIAKFRTRRTIINIYYAGTRQAFSICTARDRVRVGLVAFKGDWARRIQAFDLLEFPGSGVAAS
jgi:hypothetical protein